MSVRDPADAVQYTMETTATTGQISENKSKRIKHTFVTDLNV